MLSANLHVQHRFSPNHEMHVPMLYLATVTSLIKTKHAILFAFLLIIKKQTNFWSELLLNGYTECCF